MGFGGVGVMSFPVMLMAGLRGALLSSHHYCAIGFTEGTVYAKKHSVIRNRRPTELLCRR